MLRQLHAVAVATTANDSCGKTVVLECVGAIGSSQQRANANAVPYVITPATWYANTSVSDIGPLHLAVLLFLLLRHHMDSGTRLTAQWPSPLPPTFQPVHWSLNYFRFVSSVCMTACLQFSVLSRDGRGFLLGRSPAKGVLRRVTLFWGQTHQRSWLAKWEYQRWRKGCKQSSENMEDKTKKGEKIKSGEIKEKYGGHKEGLWENEAE